MTKIVYNETFGGFDLSAEACKLYAKRKGWKYETITDNDMGYAFTYSVFIDDKGLELSPSELPRDCPYLASVVEFLGSEKASGNHAKLAIRELPKGTKYRISEYDGNESVMTIDEYDWKIA